MNQTNQLLLRIIIALVITMCIVTTVVVLAGDMFSSGNGKLIFTTYSMLFYGITASFCLSVISKPAFAALGFSGVVISIVGFLLSVGFILTDAKGATITKIVFTFYVLAVTLAQISFLHYLKSKNRYADIARFVAVIFISLFAILLIVKIFDSFETLLNFWSLEFYARVLAACLIMDVGASLLVGLCNRLQVERKNEWPVDPHLNGGSASEEQKPI